MSIGNFEKRTIEKAAILLGYPDAIDSAGSTALILTRAYPDARDEALLSFLGHTAGTTVNLTQKVHNTDLNTMTFVVPPEAVAIKEVFGVAGQGIARRVSDFIEDADGIHIDARHNVYPLYKASIISDTAVLSRRGLKSYAAHLLAIDVASSVGRSDYVQRLNARALTIKNAFSTIAFKSVSRRYATHVYGATFSNGGNHNYGNY